jgi:cytochrome P450
MPKQMKKLAKTMQTNPKGGNTMKDYLMRISTAEADVEIEPRNDLDTILLSIEDESGLKAMALDAGQAEKLAAMLTIAVSIARGK